MSRIHILNPWMGQPKLKFHPFEYGDGYQKMTWLWGNFKIPVKHPVQNEGNWMFKKLGGKSEKTKTIRSTTPLGFAYAFYEANHL